MTTVPRWLTDTTILGIYAQQIERFGGAHGITVRTLRSRGRNSRRY